MDKSLDAIYNLSSSQEERERDWQANKSESAKILSEYELDAVEMTIVVGTGVLAGVADMFFVTDVRKLSKTDKFQFVGEDCLKDKGYINKKADKFIKNLISEEKRKELEEKYKVCYDSSQESVEGQPDIKRLNAKTHRQQSFGHDPILGFFYGVRDIMNDTLTAVDENGEVIIRQGDNKDIAPKLFEAIATQWGHLLSDISTPAGLPIPFMSQLMRIKGSYGEDDNDMTYQHILMQMYKKGYNLNHLLAMGMPSLIIEAIVRISFFAYQLYQGKSFVEALPINKHKVHKMLLYSYLIATSSNAVKIWLSRGNIFAANPTFWWGVVWNGFIELKRWSANEVERKRHRYAMELYDQRMEELNAEIERELSFYNVSL